MIRNKLTSVQRMEVASDRMGGRDVLQTVLHADTDMIRHDARRDRPRRLSGRGRRAHGRASASTSSVCARPARSRTSSAFTSTFCSKMSRSCTRTASARSSSRCCASGRATCCSASAFPRYSKRTLSAMQYARDRGATRYRADRLVSCRRWRAWPTMCCSRAATWRALSIRSWRRLSVINALIVAVGMSRRDEIEQTFNKLERIWEEYDVYEKPEDDTN